MNSGFKSSTEIELEFNQLNWPIRSGFNNFDWT